MTVIVTVIMFENSSFYYEFILGKTILFSKPSLDTQLLSHISNEDFRLDFCFFNALPVKSCSGTRRSKKIYSIYDLAKHEVS